MIAGHLYRHMQDVARRKVERGTLLPAVAAAKLRPWAALAIHVGADLLELEASPPEDTSRAAWVPTLAQTRDHALDRHQANPTTENEKIARDLCTLANHFAFSINGDHPVPPYQPSPERRAVA